MKRIVIYTLALMCLFMAIAPLGIGAQASASAQYPPISLSVPSYKQSDSRWGALNVGRSGKTMAAIGCAITSLAMTESYRTGTTVTPATMRNRLSFNARGALYWPSHYALRGPISYQQLYETLKRNIPVIAGARRADGGTHFVVIKGFAGGNSLSASSFIINDPGSTTRTRLSQFFAAYPTLYRRVHY